MCRASWIGSNISGKRRFLRALAVADAEVTAALDAIFAPLAAATRKSHIPRPELMSAAALAWPQTVPTFGRLGAPVIKRSRRSLRITEPRLTGGTAHAANWEAGAREAAIGIILTTLIVERGRSAIEHDVACLVSLHSIGRYFERSGDPTDAGLTAALAELARACGDVWAAFDETREITFSVPVRSGTWVGFVTRRRNENIKRDVRLLNVRSFIP